MNTNHAAKASARRKSKPARSLAGGSAEASRLAVAILEVLAGLRSPGDAAQALGLSAPRYYQLEIRALEGLVAACESRPKGRQPGLEATVARLERQLAKARAEAARQQALVRAAQRTIGLKPPAAPASSPASGQTNSRRRRRRPTVRALKAIALLAENCRDAADAGVQTQLKDTDGSAAGGTGHARTHDKRTPAGSAAGRVGSGQGAARGDPDVAHGRADDRAGQRAAGHPPGSVPRDPPPGARGGASGSRAPPDGPAAKGGRCESGGARPAAGTDLGA